MQLIIVLSFVVGGHGAFNFVDGSSSVLLGTELGMKVVTKGQEVMDLHQFLELTFYQQSY